MLQKFKPAYHSGYRIAVVSNISRFFKKLFKSYGNRCYDGGVCEVSSLLGCDTMLIVKYFPTFRKILCLLLLRLSRPKKSFAIDTASYLRRVEIILLIFGHTLIRCICNDILRDSFVCTAWYLRCLQLCIKTLHLQ
jgi:hypothetical protein